MNHINALIELAELWEVQAGMDVEPGNAKRRETLRECADALKMLLGGAKLAASQTEQRTRELEDLLRSACAIADRSGQGTAWNRFGASVRALGLNGVTARTYRVLPSDGYRAPPSREYGGIDD